MYLLDDHEIVRRGIKGLLEAEGDIEVVGESGSAQAAMRQVPSLCPDVAVLDVRLQDGSGIEVCRELHSSAPGVHTLILTSYDDDEALFAAIMAGASGYLLKVIAGSDVVSAVRSVSKGQSLIDPTLMSRVLERLRRGPVHEPELASLSEQERKVLTLIAEGRTNRQIASQMFLSEKTVKNYVSSILTKLGLESRTQAAVLATKIQS
ncbi:two component transcriptional regulator, LuxR family [Sanguibacter gelidistatuariae]|uniref:Two component transcriptional regulator, LuxR family n=1 Tax=Sanguibacter gelidistatuariae TaxID=1814289 RepID=A0A1G6K2B5_9MICO|nr:two component transcriptional regulator, LuxR family [Sanguibacter gelidistatuariae]